MYHSKTSKKKKKNLLKSSVNFFSQTHFSKWVTTLLHDSLIIVASISDLLAPKWHKTVQNKLQYGPDCVWKVSKMGLTKNKSMKTHLSERCKNTFCSSCMFGRHPQRSQEMSLKHTSPFEPCSHYSSQCLILTSTFPPPLAWCVCVACAQTLFDSRTPPAPITDTPGADKLT